MNKRASLILAFSPVLLFAILFFLSQTSAVTGDAVQVPLLQGPNESEPNDDIATADPIDVNLTMVGTIPITRSIDVDWYRLILPSADLGRDFRATLEETLPDADYRLELNLYDSSGSLVDSDSQQSTSSLEWTSSVITYYLRVRAIEFDTISAPGDADYELTVIRFAAEPTDTPTVTPVPWDDCEVNDTIDGTWSPNTPPGGPCMLAVGETTEDLNFVPYTGQPAPNNDYFTFLAKQGRTYRITTDVFGGADTEMWLYDPSNTQIAYDDDGGDGVGSRIERTLNNGWHKILVRDRLANPSPSTAQSYDIVVEDVTPDTVTLTPTPTSTSRPPRIPGEPDIFEPNYDFNRATLIGLATKYTNLNFVPWTGTGQDNDFYKLWVVAGRLYTCESTELGSATNTNLIICSGPSWDQCFAGNDDVEPFDPADPYRSRLTFFSSYTGYLYLILGQVGADRILPEEWADLTYSLRCFIDLPGTATPTPTSPFVPPPPAPTSTPQATPLPIASPSLPTPTPVQLVVLPMTTPTPPATSVPAGTPTPMLFVVELMLYYDRNGNGQMEAGEGILDVLARAYDAISGELLSIDYSDQTGFIRFAVPGRGPVRISVPYFGFNQIVTRTNARIPIRVSPQP